MIPGGTYRDLRPLGIGEILDRAVTLFVQRFALLVLILALIAVPVAICQYIAQPQLTDTFDQMSRVFSLPPGHQAEQRDAVAHLLAQNRMGALGFTVLLLATLFGSLSITACIIAVSQSYAGLLPSVRDVYRRALSRWFAQIVALVFYIAIVFVFLIVVAIALTLVSLAVAALSTASRIAALVVGIPTGILVLLALFAIAALCYFAVLMTTVSIALEDPNPIRGIARGLRRTLGGPMFWRSLRVAVVVLLVLSVGQIVVLSVAALASVLAHFGALYMILSVIGGVVINALITTFAVVYAFDVKVRREGFDLTLAAEQPL